MVRKWHSRIWKPKKNGESWRGARAGYVDPGEFAHEIFPSGDFASLFVYMYRRFGITEQGSDPYKEIACWYITTPDPNVILIVSPRPTGLRYSFGYWIDTNIYNEWKRDESLIKKAEDALKDAMRDLLIPTNVRDEYINATGKIKEESFKQEVSYSKWAGFGVTSDYYKKFNAEPTHKR